MCWEPLSDDILYNQRKLLNSPELNIGKYEIKNLALYEVEKSLRRRWRSLRDFNSMPYSTINDRENSLNRMLLDELNYDRKAMAMNMKSYCQQWLLNNILDMKP
ncbi:ATP-dependent DNA helicase PIF1 [Striga asiatica]|uniref:ATP-dependent DNA helicase PIF1 n=1 Tax=Striga asiatica TaxID=4170 RepID=A0A5A7RFZ3_STRAF|nr:ATP-dependent DNA helicase PIF1 [Striga asiatica]